MKPIGGYFELELNKGVQYHSDAIKLNSGRNALQYILMAGKYQRIYMPLYTCDVLLHAVKTTGVDTEFYSINQELEPIFDFSKLSQKDTFLYTNYFGLKDDYIKELRPKCNHLIIDNAQSFYSKPLPLTDTFYSPRKFFGVPDGGYLYTAIKLKQKLVRDISFERFEHLLKRIDLNAEAGYSSFGNNDKLLNNLPILGMSNLTEAILSSIDYAPIAEKRRENFLYVNKRLRNSNQLRLDLNDCQIPMVYPYLPRTAGLRSRLTNNKVYVARYWPNVLESADKNSLEFKFACQIIPLPIDQRYTTTDLEKYLTLI